MNTRSLLLEYGRQVGFLFIMPALTAACLLLFLLPAPARAQDTDGDGLTDAAELAYTPSSFSCAGSNCAASGCGWLSYNGHSYLLCTAAKPWTEARDFCRSYGGDLAAIDNAAEDTQLWSSMGGASFWFGFSDLEAEGTFAWSHGAPTPTTYTNWNTATGEPSNGGGNEDCGQAFDLFEGKWNDNGCGNLFRFVCEDHFALNPYNADSDGDGLRDGWEFFNLACGFDPQSVNQASADNDSDGLSNLQEQAVGTDPCDPDTDGDIMPDVWENQFGGCGLDPIISDDEFAPPVLNHNVANSAGFLVDLVWTGAEYGLAYSDSEAVYFMKLDPLGAPIGGGVMVSQGTYPTQVSVAWSGSDFGMVWDVGTSAEAGVVFQRINAAGVPVQSSVPIPTGKIGLVPDLAWNGSEFMVTWHYYSTSSTLNCARFARLTDEGSILSLGDIACLSRPESFVPLPGRPGPNSVVWTGSEYGLTFALSSSLEFVHDLYFGRISATGSKRGADIKYQEFVYTTSQSNPLIWTGTDFGVLSKTVSSTVTLFRFGADGAMIGSGREVNSYGGFPSLAFGDGEFLAVWNNYSPWIFDIGFQRLSSQGDPIGGIQSLGAAQNSGYMVSAVRAGQRFGAAWISNGSVHFARLGGSHFDNDDDGLADSLEYTTGTNPCEADTDGDGMKDGWEVTHSCSGSSPLVGDATLDGDADGLTNITEMAETTDPCNPDTDSDGLTDGDEVNTHFTDPFNPDCDGDGLTDGAEVHTYGSLPLAIDSDGDGLDDYIEAIYSVNPILVDGDNDGLTDPEEALFWLTDPTSADTDGDGMSDGFETAHPCLFALIADGGADPDGDGQTSQAEFLALPPTDPCALTDTDSDGMSDWWETNMSEAPGCVLNPSANDAAADPDSDGRTNLVEYNDHTDPCASNLLAESPRLVNYQGRLTNNLGAPANGAVVMSFSLFSDPTGGTALWSESHTVTVTGGIYSVTLGGDTLIPASALARPELYLQISAGGQVLVPRQKITAVLLAMDSMRIEGKRLETGTRTLSVSLAASQKTVHVSFDQAFASPPRVTVTGLSQMVGSVSFVVTEISNVTSTGFDVSFTSLGGAASGSANFGYNAFGE